MVRDFIKESLYSKSDGYFIKKNHQVGELKAPIQFKNLLGYHAYRQELKEKYPENAWVTPSEIFKPYYGYMIANYMIEKWLSHNYKKIKIIEIGPGRGALAESIIQYLSMSSLERKLIYEYH